MAFNRSQAAATTLLLSAVLLAPGCGRKAPAPGAREAARGLASPMTGQADSKKFGEAGTLLMKACTEPTIAFHFSYKAQSQINPKYPMDEKAKPEVGPVTLEADIGPDEIRTLSERGAKRTEGTARKDKDLDWAMIKMALLGPTSDVSMTMAFASPVAGIAGSDTVGAYAADRYEFDTRTANATQKMGMEAAQAMLRGRVKHEAIYGTAWVDKASGMLVKFNMDSELSDKGGNTWKEHYEGLVTRK